MPQKAALAGLDTLEANHYTQAKSAVLRGIAALTALEPLLAEIQSGEPIVFKEGLTKLIQQVKKLGKKELKEIEKETVLTLKQEGALEEVPALIACDMNYETAGVKITEYRTSQTEYRKVVESIRAEILEEGEPSLESVCLLWMFRESCLMSEVFSSSEQILVKQKIGDISSQNDCFRREPSLESVCLLWMFRESCLMSEVFSSSEQILVKQKIGDISSQNDCFRRLFEAEFHSVLSNFSTSFLKAKKNLFQNPYLEGVNLMFPFLERRSAIFIDFVVLGTTVADRRKEVLCYLSERGHYAEEVKNGRETLLRIDNSYYRIFPMTKAAYHIPIQGASLVPVYY